MMLRQRLAIAAATPNLIPMPAAHASLDRSTIKAQCVRSSGLSKTDARTPQIPIHRSGETEPLPARDFVPWRFSDAGRQSAWMASTFRRPRNLHNSGHAAAAASSASGSSILSRNVPNPPAVRRNFFVTVAQEHALACRRPLRDGKPGFGEQSPRRSLDNRRRRCTRRSKSARHSRDNFTGWKPSFTTGRQGSRTGHSR
jgi:hypothetical protein